VTYPVDSWLSLVELEATRSELSFELVRIQLDIIKALRAGSAVSSPSVEAQIVEANEAKEMLSYTGVQIDLVRETILNL
jgi:hypothetical protein